MLSLLLPAFAADYAAFAAAIDSSSGWEEVDRKAIDGVGEVVVRHKLILGQHCLEGTAYAKLPVETLLAASIDITHQGSWSTWSVPRSVKLSSGSSSFDYYQVLDNPFPIDDRYWFLHGTVVTKGADRMFMWEAIDPATLYPDALASVKTAFPSAVMTTVNVGDWTFTPSGDQTRVRYRICTDAGGNIPDWAGQYAARTTLPTNIADLVKEVKRRVGQ
jgi:hypothetical protein